MTTKIAKLLQQQELPLLHNINVNVYDAIITKGAFNILHNVRFNNSCIDLIFAISISAYIHTMLTFNIFHLVPHSRWYTFIIGYCNSMPSGEHVFIDTHWLTLIDWHLLTYTYWLIFVAFNQVEFLYMPTYLLVCKPKFLALLAATI